MRFLGSAGRSFENPQTTVQLLLGLNIVVYGLCMMQSGSQANIPPEILFRYGAMYSQAIDRHEYWRLIASGFLHASPIHVLGNMMCLVLWGGLLEKRLGAFYFTVIYASGLVAGAIASLITHTGPFISVGASGAISAVLGALLALRLLGRIALPWSFFAINIGLNVALAASVTRIDWGAHLGGFIAGMIACACLDLLERVFAVLLRCKFPEFVKMNVVVALVVVAAYCWTKPMVALSQQSIWVIALVAGVAAFAVIKVIDLTLSMKKGLAIVVIALALANATLVLLWSGGIAQTLASLCASRLSAQNAIAVAVASVCANIDRSIGLASFIVFAMTMLVYWPQFARGMSDVGFVSAGLRGERGRRQGL